MNSFRFEQPEWLHAVWGVLALVGVLTALELRGQSVLDRFLSPAMQSRLVLKTSLARRLLALGLFGAALVCLVFAMMRPQWGMTVQRATRVDSQIMICLDVSKSMLAEDVVPNRLERAKAEIDSLLSLLGDGQQVGLIAFAGKATVMCPMTTDFGFLRLILAEASPASVGLGGTRIGDAVHKAVDGFRDVGDVNRLVLLITDGEDHDSFPMDAAKEAKEKGVRIVSIGFGDEAGSKIEVTDPATGARRFVTDRDGQPVISRLDGETLRSVALETEGAYIPAGTGALDLESIYRSHIATLLNGTSAQEDHVVRNEAYQWCVLMALVLWVLSMLSTAKDLTGVAMRGFARQSVATATMKAAILLWLVGFQLTATAQNPAPPQSLDVPAAMDAPDGDDSVSAARSAEEPQKLSPREVYNQAIAFVRAEPSRAEEFLNEARSEAGVDGELRYRAIYNLGWVEIAKAEPLLESEPAEALKHLQMAAVRFREAVRVRPESKEARHNLEIVSQRILQLTDSLAKQDPTDFAQRLDELLAAQRAHQVELQSAVAEFETDEADAQQDLSAQRDAFRRLGVTQRQVIGEFERLASDARRQVDAARAKPEEEQDPQTRMQTAQLASMLQYLDRSLAWMHKARSFTRRLQAERSFLRWSAGLADARRGRDQLRNPIEILGSISADAVELAMLTGRKAHSPDALDSSQSPGGSEAEPLELPGDSEAERREPPGESEAERREPPGGSEAERREPPGNPAWLSQEYLDQTQLATTERTTELREILSYGAEQQSPAEAEQPADPQQAALLENIVLALPSIERAESLFGSAQRQIGDADYENASASQVKAIEALSDAAEYFLDFRRLIEVTYADQLMVRGGIEALGTIDSLPVSEVAALGERLTELQKKNLKRTARLGQLFQQELDKLTSSAAAVDEAADSDAEAAPNADEDQRQRFEAAQHLLSDAEQAMRQVESQFEELAAAMPAENVEDAIELPESATSLEQVDVSVEKLEELRRLFFSIVEHLRETAQRQTRLNDETTAEMGRRGDANVPQLGPLEVRQQTLEQTSRQIADALQQQSESVAEKAGNAEPDDATIAERSATMESAETIGVASELVTQASQAMQAAVEAMQADSGDVEEQTLTEEQRLALEKLVEALKLLDDAQQQGNQPQPPEDSGEEQPQEQPQSNQDQQSEQQNMNSSQMLQAIRDREAQRRRDKQQDQVPGAGSVEKDW